MTSESSSQPVRSTALTTIARVLCTPDVIAFGCATNITAIPPNSRTWGIARRCQRFTALLRTTAIEWMTASSRVSGGRRRGAR